MSQLDFMENVIISLIGGHTADDPNPAAKRVRMMKEEPPISKTVGQHSAGCDTKKSFFASSVASICIMLALSSGTEKKCNNFDKADFVGWIVCMWNEFTSLIDHKLAL